MSSHEALYPLLYQQLRDARNRKRCVYAATSCSTHSSSFMAVALAGLHLANLAALALVSWLCVREILPCLEANGAGYCCPV